MNEESLKIIADQKKDIGYLHEYMDAGFKIVCDLGKKDHRRIKFLSVCIVFMAVAMYRQNTKIKRLEARINELKNDESIEIKANDDTVEEVPME